jgi:hypothetical protein
MRSDVMASGRFTADERERILAAAREVASGRRKMDDVTRELAVELGRSLQGVRLYLGRTLRRLDGPRAPRRGGARRGGRRSLERLAALLKERADDLRALRARKSQIDARVAELEEEIKSLQRELFGRIGLELPEHAAASAAEEDRQAIPE